MKNLTILAFVAFIAAGCQKENAGYYANAVQFSFVLLDSEGRNLASDSSASSIVVSQSGKEFKYYYLRKLLVTADQWKTSSKYGGQCLSISPDYGIVYSLHVGDKLYGEISFKGTNPDDIAFDSQIPLKVDSTVTPFVYILRKN